MSGVLPGRECVDRSLPNSRDTENERFVTLTPHLGIDQALSLVALEVGVFQDSFYFSIVINTVECSTV